MCFLIWFEAFLKCSPVKSLAAAFCLVTRSAYSGAYVCHIGAIQNAGCTLGCIGDALKKGCATSYGERHSSFIFKRLTCSLKMDSISFFKNKVVKAISCWVMLASWFFFFVLTRFQHHNNMSSQYDDKGTNMSHFSNLYCRCQTNTHVGKVLIRENKEEL